MIIKNQRGKSWYKKSMGLKALCKTQNLSEVVFKKKKSRINFSPFIFTFQTGETRTISHFHYTTWPDFGVPESPASFLNFLFKVRESGSLNPEHGPAVIHCSAGIGRSGTFSLVDTCLVLVSASYDLILALSAFGIVPTGKNQL